MPFTVLIMPFIDRLCLSVFDYAFHCLIMPFTRVMMPSTPLFIYVNHYKMIWLLMTIWPILLFHPQPESVLLHAHTYTPAITETNNIVLYSNNIVIILQYIQYIPILQWLLHIYRYIIHIYQPPHTQKCHQSRALSLIAIGSQIICQTL